MTRKWFLILAAVLVLGLLGAGSYTAFQLLDRPEESAHPPGSLVLENVVDRGEGPVRVLTIVEPSSMLPDRPAEASGVLTHREGNSLFVGTGSISVNAEITNGVPSIAVDHSGPELEVVLGRETIFYEDITEISFEASEDTEIRLEQQLREAPLPETLASGANIQVWGERRGDRIIAEIVVWGEFG